MNSGRSWRATEPSSSIPRRPASATASAEFWRAFLRSPARPAPAWEPSEASVRRQTEAAPAPRGTAAGAMPSVEPADIARELGLSRFASVRALQRLRREFALRNHPDRVPPSLHARATKRMMIANALIDSALKRMGLGAVRREGDSSADGGMRV